MKDTVRGGNCRLTSPMGPCVASAAVLHPGVAPAPEQSRLQFMCIAEPLMFKISATNSCLFVDTELWSEIWSAAMCTCSSLWGTPVSDALRIPPWCRASSGQPLGLWVCHSLINVSVHSIWWKQTTFKGLLKIFLFFYLFNNVSILRSITWHRTQRLHW